MFFVVFLIFMWCFNTKITIALFLLNISLIAAILDFNMAAINEVAKYILYHILVDSAHRDPISNPNPMFPLPS